MALVKSKLGLIEIFVNECGSEAESRDVVNAAMGPYV